MSTMNKELKAVIGHVLQSNLAVLGAFIAISPSLPEEQQQKLLESLDTMKTASQALLEMLNAAKV
jgi:hypothetical protein